jgi:hypothetical protein
MKRAKMSIERKTAIAYLALVGLLTCLWVWPMVKALIGW